MAERYCIVGHLEKAWTLLSQPSRQQIPTRWFSAMQQEGVSRLTTRCVLLTTLTPMWPSALLHEDMVKKQNADSPKLGAHFPL